MNRKKTRRSRLRVKKNTLRTLSTDQAAQVHGGNNGRGLGQPGVGMAHPNSPNESRYCLEAELP